MKACHILLIGFMLVLIGCANPPYKFSPNESSALIKPIEGQSWGLCVAGKMYSLDASPKSKLLKVPADRKILLTNYMSFPEYQVTYSCFPAIGFTPESGKTYIADVMIGMTGCNIGLTEEDKKSEIGLKPALTISRAVCPAE